jgi:hypothetical protein
MRRFTMAGITAIYWRVDKDGRPAAEAEPGAKRDVECLAWRHGRFAGIDAVEHRPSSRKAKRASFYAHQRVLRKILQNARRDLGVG